MAGKPKTKLIVAIAVVLVVAAVVVGALYATRGTTADLVKIEIRAKPVATIRFKNKTLGRSPITIQVPRATAALEVEATFTLHGINPLNGKQKTEVRTLTKSFVPASPQSLDFDVKDAKPVPGAAP